MVFDNRLNVPVVRCPCMQVQGMETLGQVRVISQSR
jgi:hypothetical protein